MSTQSPFQSSENDAIASIEIESDKRFNDVIDTWEEQDSCECGDVDGDVYGDVSDEYGVDEGYVNDGSDTLGGDDDSTSACSTGGRMGRLVSSMLSGDSSHYAFSDDAENDGDIDSSGDERDVFIDALETSYV